MFRGFGDHQYHTPHPQIFYFQWNASQEYCNTYSIGMTPYSRNTFAVVMQKPIRFLRYKCNIPLDGSGTEIPFGLRPL